MNKRKSASFAGQRASQFERLETRSLLTAVVEVLDSSGTWVSADNPSLNWGQAVHVRASGTTLNVNTGNDNRVNLSRFEWNFGDSSGRYASLNKLRGFSAAHLYDPLGASSSQTTFNYTVTLTITDASGTVETDSIALTLNRPTTRETWYIDPDAGSDSNNGLSESSPFQTITKLQSMAAWSNGDAVLLKRTATVYDSTTHGRFNITKSNILVGAYGSDLTQVPTLSYSGTSTTAAIMDINSAAKNVIVRDIAFTVNSAVSKTSKWGINTSSAKNVTVLNCKFLRLDTGVQTNSSPEGVLVQSCYVPSSPGIRGGLSWVSGTNLTFLGNQVDESQNEHNIRVSQANYVLIAQNKFTNTGTDGKMNINLQQGNYMWVDQNDCTTSGGTPITIRVGPLNEGTGHRAERIKYVVVERNHAAGGYAQVGDGAEHVSFRNNILHFDDNNVFNLQGYNTTLDADNQAYNRNGVDIRVENNTLLNNGTQNFGMIFGGGNSAVIVRNNLFVAPNFTSAVVSSGATRVFQSDLTGFREFSSNVWNAESPYGSRGIHAFGSGTITYRTNSSLDSAFSQSDRNTSEALNFASDFTVPSRTSTTATWGRPVGPVDLTQSSNAALSDYYGLKRPSAQGSQMSAGALEVVVPPRVTSETFLYDTLPFKVTFTFDQDVSASISLADFTVQKIGGSVITPSAYNYNSSTKTATLTFGSTALADGNYRVTISSSGVTNASGQTLDGDADGISGPSHVYDFFFLLADIDHDRDVDTNDLYIFQSHYGETGTPPFSNGNVNYDSIIDSLDFNVISGRQGTVLAP
jgi:hypothetical protein